MFKQFYIWFILASAIFIFPCRIKAYGLDAEPVLPVQRLSGGDRYQTAVTICRERWASSEYVILATGEGDDKFADAMAGSPLAYSKGAPILLTAANILPPCTKDEIIRLGTTNIILLGGPGVISENIENTLNSMGILTERIGGSDRYFTSAAIADKLGETKPFTKVFLTYGEAFQYSMMIAPYASRNGIPIIFSGKESLGSASEEIIRKWGVTEVDIIGNTDTISKSVEDSLIAMGIKVNRVGGSNLTETNINIIKKYEMNTNYISIARDDVFADGLSGAVFAAMKNMNIILTGRESADAIIINYLKGCSLQHAYVFGGPGAVSDYIVEALRNGNCRDCLPGNTQANINNGGLASSAGGWIYYHNSKMGGSLYKTKINSTEKIMISADSAMNINVMGDWVYYTNISDGSKLYKVKIDGSLRTRLNDDISWNAIVIDNWIYYINLSDNGCPYRISTDGTLRSRLYETDSKYLYIEYYWIYFINSAAQSQIYRIKSDNLETVQRLNGIHASSMDISGGWIYFSNEKDNRSLYKINKDGTGLLKVSGDAAYDIHVIGDTLYYSNGSDNDKLYKIKVDGTGRCVVYNGSTYLINIVGDWIYFFPGRDGLNLYKIRMDGTGLSEVD